MRRNLLALFAVGALLVFAGVSEAQETNGHWKFVDLKWRTTLTSGTTPTYASLWGGGANAGNKWVDSTFVSGAGSAATDTSVAFTLSDLGKYSNPVLKATGVAGVAQRTAVKDTTRALVLTFFPVAQSSYVEEMAATDDVVLQGSFDGATWFNLITGKSFTELASGNDHFVMELKSDRYYGETTGYGTDTSDETTWWGLPMYRLVVSHTVNGQMAAVLRYWAEE